MTTKQDLLTVVSKQCHECVGTNSEVENCTFWGCSLRTIRPRYKSLHRVRFNAEHKRESIQLGASGKNIPESMLCANEDEGDRRKSISRKKIMSMIRQHCIFCMNGQPNYVAMCASTDCKLYPYRRNKDPHPHPSMVKVGKLLGARMKKEQRGIFNGKSL